MQLRRLNADHAALHSTPPADYLIPQQIEDLLNLDVYLVGPAGTPFESGVFKLNVRLPHTYPLEPPMAHFRTKIWHPNVDEHTGEVCVDMLKTSWEKEYTLKDILDTIRCLLIQPNPSSALNSDAGLLCEEDYRAFFKHAKLMTKVHAPVPAHIRHIVREIRQRAGDSEYDVYEHRRSESPIELYADEDDENNSTPVRPPSPYAEQSDYEGDTDVEMSDAEDLGKENSRNAGNVPPKPRRVLAPVSPLRKRRLDDALEDYEEGRSVSTPQAESSSSSSKRKSPKLEGRRESGVNSNGRIRSADEEAERRKRKEMEKKKIAASAVRKPAVRKGLKRL